MGNSILNDGDYLRIFSKVFNKVKRSLIDWDFKDINLAINGGAKRGAFILASCFIDHLSCYYSGEESTGQNYKCFVRDFLPQYDAEELYKDIRCKLVHNYSLGNNYSLTHHNCKYHMKKDSNNRTMLNLRSFINEIRKARDTYFEKLVNDDGLKIKFAKWYKTGGVLQPSDIQT